MSTIVCYLEKFLFYSMAVSYFRFLGSLLGKINIFYIQDCPLYIEITNIINETLKKKKTKTYNRALHFGCLSGPCMYTSSISLIFNDITY